MLPSENNGAQFVYTNIIRRFLLKHERKIESAVKSATAAGLFLCCYCVGVFLLLLLLVHVGAARQEAHRRASCASTVSESAKNAVAAGANPTDLSEFLFRFLSPLTRSLVNNIDRFLSLFLSLRSRRSLGISNAPAKSAAAAELGPYVFLPDLPPCGLSFVVQVKAQKN
jgi:hypothetical protein